MKDNIYSQMQKRVYENEALNWSVENLDPVVGSFLEHNKYEHYELLFKDVENLKDKVVLDFACGPARNLVLYHDRVKRIDGVDISQRNLSNAVKWIEHNKLNPEDFSLFENNGYDLANVPSDFYDLVISTIAMQHICVYSIRFQILKEVYRVLKNGGQISFQMGYGNSIKTVDYFDDYFEAEQTNRACDTRVTDPKQVENDLLSIGFKDFKYYLRPTGPGDFQENSEQGWLFFSSTK